MVKGRLGPPHNSVAAWVIRYIRYITLLHKCRPYEVCTASINVSITMRHRSEKPISRNVHLLPGRRLSGFRVARSTRAHPASIHSSQATPTSILPCRARTPRASRSMSGSPSASATSQPVATTRSKLPKAREGAPPCASHTRTACRPRSVRGKPHERVGGRGGNSVDSRRHRAGGVEGEHLQHTHGQHRRRHGGYRCWSCCGHLGVSCPGAWKGWRRWAGLRRDGVEADSTSRAPLLVVRD